MDETTEVPSQLKTASIVQLIAGLVNFFFVGWMASFFWGGMGGTITTICTLGMCPIGGLCGFVGCLIAPIAIAEIASGAMGLSNPEEAGGLQKIVAFLEVASLLIGNPVAVIAGAVVLFMLNNDEVTEYMEARDG